MSTCECLCDSEEVHEVLVEREARIHRAEYDLEKKRNDIANGKPHICGCFQRPHKPECVARELTRIENIARSEVVAAKSEAVRKLTGTPATPSPGLLACDGCGAMGRIDGAQCSECDGTGLVECEHSSGFDPDEGFMCLDCEYEGVEDVMCLAYDQAKDRRKYGD